MRHHRFHHRNTDRALDPHSSYEGFFWSHCGWLMHSKVGAGGGQGKGQGNGTRAGRGHGVSAALDALLQQHCAAFAPSLQLSPMRAAARWLLSPPRCWTRVRGTTGLCQTSPTSSSTGKTCSAATLLDLMAACPRAQPYTLPLPLLPCAHDLLG